ncbi:hypothetical protein IQ274_32825 [Nostoc sp. LEGE 12447]|nr:hypothetical protein [Nostoc sp. LEGE 12447]MBE9002841.1 hypothetical protein [Nostoc sp. LEGE 12447]
MAFRLTFDLTTTDVEGESTCDSEFVVIVYGIRSMTKKPTVHNNPTN